jgi:hypothetical protein
MKPLPRASLAPLKFNVRAGLFKQLATIKEAGLPVDKALGLARLPSGGQIRLR